MRELLFRGQTRRYGEKVKPDGSKLPGSWAYGGICHGKGDFSVIYGYESGAQDSIKKFVVYTATVCQCTGLTDRTLWHELTEAEQKSWLRTRDKDEWQGRPIFEGDILLHSYDYRSDIPFDVGVVFWQQDTCMYLRTSRDHPGRTFQIAQNCRYKILGNRYDNPELMAQYFGGSTGESYDKNR